MAGVLRNEILADQQGAHCDMGDFLSCNEFVHIVACHESGRRESYVGPLLTVSRPITD